MDYQHSAEASAGLELGAVIRAIVRVLTVPIAWVMAGCEPLIRVLFWSISALGLLATLVIAGSGSAPRFPLLPALLVFAGLGIIPAVYRAILRRIRSF